MGRRAKRPSALKHAGYSETEVLPGESQAEFNKLRRQVFADLKPEGPLENEIVSDIARLLWRKRNLRTYRIAAAVRKRCEEIEVEFRSAVPDPPVYHVSAHAEISEKAQQEHYSAIMQAKEAATVAAKNELGSSFVFVEHGIAHHDRLSAELDLEERLQSLMERCIKRLLHVKGLKSLIASPPVPTSNVKQLPAKRDAA